MDGDNAARFRVGANGDHFAGADHAAFTESLWEISRLVGRATAGRARVLAAPQLFDTDGRYVLGAQGGSLGASVIAISLYDAAGTPLSREQLVDVARHEVIHFLRRHEVIDKAAWRVFESQAPAWRQDFDIDAIYAGGGLDTEQLNEEATAFAYAEWAARRYTAPARVLAPFRRLQGFYDRVREGIHARVGSSAQEARAWFDRIERGLAATEGLPGPTERRAFSEMSFSSRPVTVSDASFARRSGRDADTLDLFAHQEEHQDHAGQSSGPRSSDPAGSETFGGGARRDPSSSTAAPAPSAGIAVDRDPVTGARVGVEPAAFRGAESFSPADRVTLGAAINALPFEARAFLAASDVPFVRLDPGKEGLALDHVALAALTADRPLFALRGQCVVVVDPRAVTPDLLARELVWLAASRTAAHDVAAAQRQAATRGAVIARVLARYNHPAAAAEFAAIQSLIRGPMEDLEDRLYGDLAAPPASLLSAAREFYPNITPTQVVVALHAHAAAEAGLSLLPQWPPLRAALTVWRAESSPDDAAQVFSAATAHLGDIALLKSARSALAALRDLRAQGRSASDMAALDRADETGHAAILALADHVSGLRRLTSDARAAARIAAEALCDMVASTAPAPPAAEPSSIRDPDAAPAAPDPTTPPTSAAPAEPPADYTALWASLRREHPALSLDATRFRGPDGTPHLRVTRFTMAEAARGQGHGAAAMARLLAFADANGLGVTVSPSRAEPIGAQGQAFLARHGFRKNVESTPGMPDPFVRVARSQQAAPVDPPPVASGAPDSATTPAPPAFVVTTATHVRKGFPLWVVQLPSRADDATFRAMVADAKSRRGWWSSEARGGAIPGFQFRAEADAAAFVAQFTPTENGQTTAAAGALPTREPLRPAIQRLRTAILSEIAADPRLREILGNPDADNAAITLRREFQGRLAAVIDTAINPDPTDRDTLSAADVLLGDLPPGPALLAEYHRLATPTPPASARTTTLDRAPSPPAPSGDAVAAHVAVQAAPHQAPSSFSITDSTELAPAGQAAKVRANLAALALLRSLDDEGRQARPDEQAILARYSGWGHAPQIFDEDKDGNWAAWRDELRGLLTVPAYAAARLTTLNAHYTSPAVTTAIWGAMRDLGFTGGRVLEPGCGTGNFIGAMPEPLRSGAQMVGVELDPTTAAIARHLYPAAEIRAEGFEATRLPPASFDLVIGNVPFGKVALHDPAHNRAGHSIHNHFIVKSLALAKPGAVMAVVTSRFTLDARNPAARRDMADHADLLGAIRLPETAFRATAGTDVVTDILLFRKRLPGESAGDQSWLGTTATDVGTAEPVFVNSYFADHPEQVLGTYAVERGMHNAETLTVKSRGDDLAAPLRAALAAVVAEARALGRVWAPQQAPGLDAQAPATAPAAVKEGSFFVADDGTVRIRRDGYAVDAGVAEKDIAEVKALIAMRDTVHEILDLQSRDESFLPAVLAEDPGAPSGDGPGRQPGVLLPPFFVGGPHEPTQEAPTVHHAIRRDLLQRQSATGHEHLYLVGRDGRVFYSTDRDAKSVDFPPGVRSLLRNPGAGLTVHHNHPRGSSLSAKDVALLAFPGVSRVVTQTDDNVFFAELAPRARQWVLAWGFRGASEALEKLTLTARDFGSAAGLFLEMEGYMPSSRSFTTDSDIGHRILAAVGVIDYVSTYTVVPQLLDPTFWREVSAHSPLDLLSLAAAMRPIAIKEGFILDPLTRDAVDRAAVQTGLDRILDELSRRHEVSSQETYGDRSKGNRGRRGRTGTPAAREGVDQYNGAAAAPLREASTPWAAAQARLHALYDDYVERFGPINRFTPISRGVDEDGEEVIHRRYPRLGGFRKDPDFASVLALELFDDETQTATKAPVFYRRVLNAPQVIRGADDAHGALLAVLESTGRVDVPAMAALLGTDEAAVVAELQGAIYHDPEAAAWTTADAYLSGNVRVKLRAARAAAEADPAYAANVAALERVQPRDLGPRDIKARLGAPWIPAADVTAFAREIMRSPDVSVTYSAELGAWHVAAPSAVSRSPVSRTVWGTTRRDALTLLEDALTGRPTVVYDRTADGGQVSNPKATLAACEKRERLSDEFSAWIWRDSERTERLARDYNETFNATVLRSFDGSHLRLPGLSTAIRPRTHQRNAVWRVVQDGNTLVAHAVGAGKTLASIMAAMEEKRLGLINKPAFSVPNHMLEQFAREFKQAYPAARLLLADRDEVSPEARKAFVARCALGDWDAVIFTHNTFGAIPVSTEATKAFIQEQVEQLESALRAAADAEGDRSPTVKRLEAAKLNLAERLEKLLAAENKDDGLNFERTGIDRLYVDELHLFKNLAFRTSRPGVSAAASQRAEDLYIKKEILERQHPGRSLVGMTGTPIANRVAELYIMQRYFDRPGLEARNLAHFDAWAATFGEDVTAIELAPDGASFRMSTRFARYINTPELLTHFRQFTDVQTADMLKLPVPEIQGGRPRVVAIPPTATQQAYIESIKERIEAIKNRLVDPTEDNMLKVTSDGRKAAADMRLLGFPADPSGGKAVVVADEIARIYDRTKDWEYPAATGLPSPHRGALQLVFCDLGTPKNDGSFNMYDAIKEAAVARGVPAERIRYIHDYPSDTAKARLFADCRAGRVSVLFGSTEKMGVGTNIQDRLYALHHVDCPWRPVDIEQRDGRKDRQGNLHHALGIPTETLIYGTEGTFDVYMWQTAERKARFIGQIMKGDLETREIEDVDGQALSYAEAKAILTGNPILMEKATLDAEVAKLQRAARGHDDDQQALRRTIASSRELATAAERELAALTAVQELVRLPGADTPAVASVPLTLANFNPAAVKVPVDGADSPAHHRAIESAAGKALLTALTTEWTRARTSARGRHRVEVGAFAGLPLSFETGGPLSADTVRLSLAPTTGTAAAASALLAIDVDVKSLGKSASGVPQLKALLGLAGDISYRMDRRVIEIQERLTAIAQAQGALGRPFDQQPLLDAKLARQVEIAAQLSVDMPVVDLGGSEAAADSSSAMYDERDDFDPRDKRSYTAGADKAVSFISQFRDGTERFDVTAYCRELGRATDDGNRARALGLAHGLIERDTPAFVLDATRKLDGTAYGRDDFRGREPAREVLATALAVRGLGTAVASAEVSTVERWSDWLEGLRQDLAALALADPVHAIPELLDRLVDDFAFAQAVPPAAARVPAALLGSNSPATISTALLAHVERAVSELAAGAAKRLANTPSYGLGGLHQRAPALQRAVIDALPSDAVRQQYMDAHAAYAGRQEEQRSYYRRHYGAHAAANVLAPVSPAEPGDGILDHLRSLVFQAEGITASGGALGSSWPSNDASSSPTFDLLPAFEEFAASRSGEDIHDVARAFVLAQGAARGGVEVLVAYDPAVGRVIAALTQDEADAVRPWYGLQQRMSDPSAALILHHNHPNDFPISSVDLDQQGRAPGVAWIFAHAASGEFSAARLAPIVAAVYPEADVRGAFLATAMEAATSVVGFALGRVDARRGVGRDPAARDRIIRDIAMRQLASAGALTYLTSHNLEMDDDHFVDTINECRATEASWLERGGPGGIRSLGDGRGDAPASHSSASVRPAAVFGQPTVTFGPDVRMADLAQHLSEHAGHGTGQRGRDDGGLGSGGGSRPGVAADLAGTPAVLAGLTRLSSPATPAAAGAATLPLAVRQERFADLVTLAQSPAALNRPLDFYLAATAQLEDAMAALVDENQAGDAVSAAGTVEMSHVLESLRTNAAIQVLRVPDARREAAATGVLPAIEALADSATRPSAAAPVADVPGFDPV